MKRLVRSGKFGQSVIGEIDAPRVGAVGAADASGRRLGCYWTVGEAERAVRADFQARKAKRATGHDRQPRISWKLRDGYFPMRRRIETLRLLHRGRIALGLPLPDPRQVAEVVADCAAVGEIGGLTGKTFERVARRIGVVLPAAAVDHGITRIGRLLHLAEDERRLYQPLRARTVGRKLGVTIAVIEAIGVDGLPGSDETPEAPAQAGGPRR
jgi:hypothetical protein